MIFPGQKTILPLICLSMTSACAGAQMNEASDSTDSSDNQDQLTVSSIPAAGGDIAMESKPAGEVAEGPEMRRLVDLAVKDLAGNLAISEDEIEMLQAVPVTWPDSSLGCPQPGMQYMQVLTSGARIMLRVGTTYYPYHSGGNQSPFLCKTSPSMNPLPGVDD